MVLTSKLFMASLTVLPLVVLASSAWAETPTQQRNVQVGKQLTDFKRTAYEMHREADTLKSFTRDKQLSWQSHTYRLNALKDHVNEMGKTLAELEAQTLGATESQRRAIEHARPHLVLVAQHLTQAIELVNENSNNIHWGEYAVAVSNIYDHANALHTKLDTILDYEEARMRLDGLELQPTSGSGG